MSKIDNLINEILPSLINLRHSIHREPELSFQEFNTSKKIFDWLSQNVSNLELKKDIAKTGIVGTLDNKGKCIALRAELDGLPIQEETDLEYKSIYENQMHACGHDGHMAILAGTAYVLSKLDLKNSVKFIFQPAEEYFGGAKKMIEEGVLENPKVDSIYALHGWPQHKLGEIGVKAGSFFAGVADFEITLIGKSGHAAFPEKANNPINFLPKFIDSINEIKNNLNTKNKFIINLGVIHSGSANNIIPADVKIKGTIRTFSDNDADLISKKIDSISKEITNEFDTDYKLEIIKGYPPLVNHKKNTDFIINLSQNIFNQETIQKGFPVFTAEDFSYYLEKVPGCFFTLGISEDQELPSLHNNKFDFPDHALVKGIKIMSEIITNS